MAEEAIVVLRYCRYYFDDEGNYIMHQLSEKERHAIYVKCGANAKKDYLSFDEDEVSSQLSKAI